MLFSMIKMQFQIVFHFCDLCLRQMRLRRNLRRLQLLLRLSLLHHVQLLLMSNRVRRGHLSGLRGLTANSSLLVRSCLCNSTMCSNLGKPHSLLLLLGILNALMKPVLCVIKLHLAESLVVCSSRNRSTLMFDELPRPQLLRMIVTMAASEHLVIRRRSASSRRRLKLFLLIEAERRRRCRRCCTQRRGGTSVVDVRVSNNVGDMLRRILYLLRLLRRHVERPRAGIRRQFELLAITLFRRYLTSLSLLKGSLISSELTEQLLFL